MAGIGFVGRGLRGEGAGGGIGGIGAGGVGGVGGVSGLTKDRLSIEGLGASLKKEGESEDSRDFWKDDAGAGGVGIF